MIVIEAANNNNDKEEKSEQQPSPKSELTNYSFNDETLLNLINVNANKYKTNSTTSQENDECLDHLNDLYLKEFLLKLMTHLDMSHLKLTKIQTQNNNQEQKINTNNVEIKVSVKSGNDNSTISSPLSSSSSSSSSLPLSSPTASQQHQQNISASSNETTKAALTPEQKQTKVFKQVIRLYDEAWSNFEKLRNVYALEVCLHCFYFLI